ncbi:MAG: hypothetical protein JW820_18690 [Spirochaetales bacterium]|nr:hypothetical protein [Spirochaetales bacterium]
MLKAKVAGDRLTIIAEDKEDQEDLMRWVVAIGAGEFHAANGRRAIVVGTAQFLLSTQWRIDLDLLAPPVSLELQPADDDHPFPSLLHQVLYSARRALGRFFDSAGGCT